MNTKISTKLGTLVLIIIAITAIAFVWKYEKAKEQLVTQPQNVTVPQKTNSESQTQSQKQSENTDTGITVSEPVNQWETCRNDQVGYEVKYPSEWKIMTKNIGGVEKAISCNLGMAIFTGSEDIYESDESDIYITYVDTSKGTGFIYEGSNSLDDYFAKWPEMAQKHPIIREVILNGERSVFISDYPNPEVWAYHKSKVFEISGNNISEQTFNNFLSTFKFLK